MTYEEFLNELEALEKNIFNKTDEEIDFTLLNIIKYVLAQKETKEKTEQQLQMERAVNEIIDSVTDRPNFYFDTKEHNMEKLIDKKLNSNVLPKTKEDKFATHAETNINTMMKMFDKVISTSTDTELKYNLEECKKELKKIHPREGKQELRIKIKD